MFDFLLIPILMFGGLTVLGVRDVMQKSHAVLRNYPISAHIRFLLEEIRPEMRQYFFESEKDGMPFSRDIRAVVYQRAKMVLDKRPFGTQEDVYRRAMNGCTIRSRPRRTPSEQIPRHHRRSGLRKAVFGLGVQHLGHELWRAQPQRRALAQCRRQEGRVCPRYRRGRRQPLSPRKRRRHHLGDRLRLFRLPQSRRQLQSGTVRARSPAEDQIKMVELKISQGAKPGHGGVLPAAKVSEEISRIRGVAMGEDCISPARHRAFSTPIEMMKFIGEMRRLSGGKPAGFKMCIGHPWEFLAICKAMLETGIYPDFIVVDGNEGGTGAAPLEFMDHLGMPMREGVKFVHNALIGINARDRIKIGAAGKIATAFDMARAMAIGADWCNSARGFMFALGCIQSLSCHTDRCPTGVATQDPTRNRALVVPHKTERVYNYHHATLHALAELLAAAGLEHPRDLRPIHFSQRSLDHRGPHVRKALSGAAPGELLDGTDDPRFRDAWAMARADSFRAGGVRRAPHVVPANAGTHTAGQYIVAEVFEIWPDRLRTRRMGPGVRRDDSGGEFKTRRAAVPRRRAPGRGRRCRRGW